MNTVFVLFSADCHLSYSSYEMEAVTTTKEKAIKLLLPRLEREAKRLYKDATYSSAKEMVTDLLNELRKINQTQTLDTNYVIKEQFLNQFDCI